MEGSTALVSPMYPHVSITTVPTKSLQNIPGEQSLPAAFRNVLETLGRHRCDAHM